MQITLFSPPDLAMAGGMPYSDAVGAYDNEKLTAQDLENITCEALVMTEKDAVKCLPFAKAHHWVLPVEAKMEATLLPKLLTKLKQN